MSPLIWSVTAAKAYTEGEHQAGLGHAAPANAAVIGSLQHQQCFSLHIAGQVGRHMRAYVLCLTLAANQRQCSTSSMLCCSRPGQ